MRQALQTSPHRPGFGLRQVIFSKFFQSFRYQKIFLFTGLIRSIDFISCLYKVQFYADLIDVILGWLDRDIASRTSSLRTAAATTTGSSGMTLNSRIGNGGRLNGFLQTYGYLMAAVSYIGAEQALCSVFHSVVCFSHRETFYYANYSFAGESLFRLYRHSYPPDVRSPSTFETDSTGNRQTASPSASSLSSAAVQSVAPPPTPPPHPAGWRTADHRTFFPELSTCRRDVIADLDYIGTSNDPSLCSPSRKNESRFNELDLLIIDEHDRLIYDISRELEADETSATRRRTAGAVVAGGALAYALVAVAIRCVVRAGRRCSISRGAGVGGTWTGGDGENTARRRKRKLLQQASSSIPTDSSWCPGSTALSSAVATETTVVGMDGDLLLRQLAASDGGFTRPMNDIVENNHKNAAATGTAAFPNNFPALKVACV